MAVAQQVARDAGADPQLLALKLPPHSVEAEQSLLGALLIDNQAFDRVADIVGAPLGTVGSRLHYATRQLRSALIADAQPTDRKAAQ